MSQFSYNSYTVQVYIDRHHCCIQIYTSASKSLVNKIGVVFTVQEFHVKVGKKINEEVSFYTGEMRTNICSDSR